MASNSPSDAEMVVREIDDAAALRGTITRHLYDYWCEKRGARTCPAWPDIHLMDLWQIAASLAVKDVIAGGDDFRNRYWGSRLTDALGIEGTGKTSRELYGTASDTNFVNYRRVVTTGRPVATYRRLTFAARREHVAREAVHLPLAPPGGPVSHIISAYDYDCDVSDILGAHPSA